MINQIQKPEGVTWTDEQWQAISATGKDILVAAAAGSGKTAVLVERIIKKVTSKENPTDVDRLLIVTFTNAAAAEMRKRIGEALEKELSERPSSLFLRRQLSLLNRASISTLHSFCMNIVRKYYYQVDVDPAFRIADPTEGQLLMDEVLEELFEDHYSQEDNDAFYELVDRYTGDRSDSELQEHIRKLYDFSRAHPWPDQWLDDMVKNYDMSGMEKIDDLPWLEDLNVDLRIHFSGMKAVLESAMELTRQPGGPAPYAETLEQDIQLFDDIMRAAEDSWNTLHQAVSGATFAKLKSVRGADIDKNIQEQVKKLRDKVKKQFKKIQEELFGRSPESYINDLREMEPVIDTLVSLVKEFAERFQEVKREKGLVDFTDLEHYTLAILRTEDSTPDTIKPSNAALDFQEQFVEVLVDEYQDTNLVQETILKLVTNSGDTFGNLFMVGDVKQSIYRFRLAEPGLFLNKYKLFSTEEDAIGWRIDLAKNFRSRNEVLDGTNFLFKQIMNETIGEIEYDTDAELRPGASYPESDDTKAELLLIDREDTGSAEETESEEQGPVLDQAELETAQLEARLMAKKIKEMIGDGVSKPYQVYDRKLDRMRSVTYRDIVILLRSMPWAPTIMEEFKQQGIPVYADLSTGYFEATEVSIMLSLLKVIDNPHQDIPLAAVLRSPIVGLNEDDLAQIRIADKKGTFFEAVQAAIHASIDSSEKLHDFDSRLNEWRTRARTGALSDLIWEVYSETGYYDFVGGMPGGKQRQANLRALYDRARQYEATSFRGLFRFLRFIERMQDRGDDLGTARALGEQEDVVRLMTIHKSKGLEFPVVFVAGLAKKFNMQDLNAKVLLHKELGFASKFINPKLRISYPTLPQLTMKRKMRLELIAEEMRVLYVALTRAKEKLFLIGTVKSAEKALGEWSQHLNHHSWVLPDYERSQSNSYLDWIGPALIRHKDSDRMRIDTDDGNIMQEVYEYPSKWHVDLIKAETLVEVSTLQKEEDEQFLQAARDWNPVMSSSGKEGTIHGRLSWEYRYADALTHKSKQTVTEMKRQRESVDENSDTAFIRSFKAPIEDRPKFLQKKALTPAERGTAMHMVMQHVDLQMPITEETIREQVNRMTASELLTEEQAEVIDVESIVNFFETEIGHRLLNAHLVKREIPFSLEVPTTEAYRDWADEEEESILVQGVMDCVFRDDDGIVLLDYKTDNISDRFEGDFEKARPVLEERYKIQLQVYQQALEKIWKQPVAEKVLYFFDGGHLLKR